ncbi:MAG: c-type cytochrome [Vogesella sp.]|uniref:c-type cytochrome n=1 Tax=Vogesella sp. TaxID=1904252 RepID=UPI00391A085D
MNKWFAAVMLGLACTQALAGAGEDRQRSFKKVLLSYEPIGVMLRDGPFRKDQFIKHADALKLVAREPFKLFAPGTIDEVSRAKPEIWTQAAKWKQEEVRFLQAVDALQAGARSDDLATVKNKYNAISQSCKSCHDAFRGPKK